jgi:hypothetical protein
MNIVTKRFTKCYEQLRDDNRVRSGRQFAIALDYLPQSFSEIMNGRRDVTIELLRKAVEKYKINPAYLLSGEEPMFLHNAAPQTIRTLTLLTSHSGNGSLIAHVPVHAQNQYLTQAGNPDFMQQLPVMSLPDPKLHGMNIRCFDMQGDNMEPTLYEGDKVLASFVHPAEWESALADHHVFVVVTLSGVLVRRIVNKLRDHKSLELWSDNTIYDPFAAPVKELLEVWSVQQRISSFMPHPSHRRSSVAEEVREIRQTMQQQAQVIGQMKEMVEQLAAEKKTP